MRSRRQCRHVRRKAELAATVLAVEIAREARLAAEQPPDITFGCPQPSAVLPGLQPSGPTSASQTCAVCRQYRLLVYFDFDPEAGAPFDTCAACFLAARPRRRS